ncbi:hypothetical protein [Nonomuraea sp. SYSU D8015]|uniref:hypothetical protein n=1 Tax=Nonomuraea sp. SYSU D8015 TaxID=2593644 RepID=UPI001661259B|nr:hypothetical protein [Nonomuraea sp. SYSU D8015]
MTVHEPRTSRARLAGRFVWRYVELVIAMSLGVLLITLVWGLGLPKVTRFDVAMLVMAAEMSIGVAVWLRLRRHSWAGIAEMSLAMVAPFLVLLVPFWFGVLPGDLVSSIGHGLMFVLMALVMVRRHEEYAHPLRFRVRANWVRRGSVVRPES